MQLKQPIRSKEPDWFSDKGIAKGINPNFDPGEIMVSPATK